MTREQYYALVAQYGGFWLRGLDGVERPHFDTVETRDAFDKEYRARGGRTAPLPAEQPESPDYHEDWEEK